jgi:tryptophanyl-tRNA synthetase
VLDLGCGLGAYLAALARAGFRCRGVEGTSGIAQVAAFGDPAKQEIIVEADLAQPLELDWPRSSVISLEVAEHLRPEDEGQYLATIDRYCERWLVLSWAVPGQPGHGHINCRDNAYVCERMTALGFELAERETSVLRGARGEMRPRMRQQARWRQVKGFTSHSVKCIRICKK